MVRDQELRQILALDRALPRTFARAAGVARRARSRRKDRLDPFLALGSGRNADRVADHHNADTVIHRVHVWLDARRDSGRKRAIDAADHRDNAVTG